MNVFDALTPQNHRKPAIHLSVRPNPKTGESATKEISTLISDRLMSLTLTDNSGFEADQLDITLDDADGELALPSRGAILSLGLGWKNEPLTFKGDYTVDEVEHSGSPDQLTIRARSADMRGSLQKRYERSFHQTTLGEIVAQIAQENQLTPMVGEAFKGKAIAHKDQTNESSMSFLQRLAEEFDAIATVKNGRLLFIPAGQGKTAKGQSIPATLITRQRGDNHRFSIAEGDNYTAVTAYWHDTKTGKRGEVTWDENSKLTTTTKPTLKKITKVKKDANGKAVKGADGKSIQESAYVQGKGRKVNVIEQRKPVESDSDNIKTLRHTYASQQSAINAVKNAFRKIQRGVATFSLELAVGNAELMPEMPVTLQGFKAEIDSTEWIIRRVTHAVSPDAGFTTSIECELKVEEK